MPKVSNKTRCRGAALVEMAIVVLLLFLLTFGIIEYGWLFLKAQQITNATRQGARVGVRWGATNANVIAAINTLMTSAGMEGKYDTPTISPADIYPLRGGIAITVTVTVPTVNIALVNIPLLPKPTYISASVTMAKEGP